MKTDDSQEPQYHKHLLSSLDTFNKTQNQSKETTIYVYKDSLGQWRRFLQASNGKKIANSGEGCQNGTTLTSLDLQRLS